MPKRVIVDGQQRLTSLYAVGTGQEVVKEDFSTPKITIAFRPADGTFEVVDVALGKDPEYLPDNSALWQLAFE